ncbi:MAG: serine/threonine protein kinase [Thermoanaerobaculia bacterium]|nr:serine/threonine protein kinase [Thermoanaerobaculia bacterium]
MASLRSLLRHPPLLTRMAAALALLGLLPVALLATRLMGINRQSMADQVDKTHVLTARKTAEGIEAFLAARLALAEGLAANPALAAPRSQPARELLGRNLQAWSGLGVAAVAVVDPGGEQVVLAQLAAGTGPASVRATVADLFGRPADVGRVDAHRTADGLLVLRFGASLPGSVGAVWLFADGAALDELLDAFELGEEASVALLDSRGEAILGSAEGFPAALLEQAGTGWIQGADPGFRAGEGSEESVGAYAPVPLVGWAVVSRQPARIARAAELRMRRQTGWALGVATLLVGLLSGGAYLSVVRPIRQLVSAQRQLAGGGDGGGGDEIEQLKSSFALLEQRLKQRAELDEVFLGRYQVREVVGSGAMGTVFEGWDPKLQRPVALKTIRLDAELEPDRRKELITRLLEEAIMVAQFSHQNIVSVHDVEDRGEGAFVAMEYVDGESLEHLLWREGRLDQDRTLCLGAAVARAVQVAHEHGLLHRDIKPANILLGRDGSIKVTDFGISELITSMSGRAEVIFGTPGYLPPESLEGEGYRRSGDLYALGVVLYFCLTGRRPFEGGSVRELIRKTLSGKFTRPRRLAPEIEPELDEIVTELLQRQPEKRPSDAGEIAARLERLVARRGARWTAPESPAGQPAAHPAPGDNAQFVPTRRIEPDAHTVTVPPGGDGIRGR